MASFCGANGTGETAAALLAGGGEASVTGGLSDSAAALAGAAEVDTARDSLGAGAGAIGCALAATDGALNCRVTGAMAGKFG